jgi:hypothetical protein
MHDYSLPCILLERRKGKERKGKQKKFRCGWEDFNLA